MRYAVITSGGKQYKVTEGDIIEVDNLNLPVDSQFTFEYVLLLVDGEDRKIGKPYIAGTSVKGKVVAAGKGKKIRVAKFKAKARYRKVIGFRPTYTKVQISNIESKGKTAKS